MSLGFIKDTEGKGLLSVLLEFLAVLVVVIVISIGIRVYVAEPYEVPSGSMEYTIQPGDMVLSEKLSYKEPNSVLRSQIVTFTDPEVPSRILIKRCIALGGQTVDIANGKVYVDGNELYESYANGETYPLSTQVGELVQYPYTVPEGCLWVMGDNRNDSIDSRYFGAIPESSVTGRAFVIFWPLDHWMSLVGR